MEKSKTFTTNAFVQARGAPNKLGVQKHTTMYPHMYKAFGCRHC